MVAEATTEVVVVLLDLLTRTAIGVCPRSSAFADRMFNGSLALFTMGVPRGGLVVGVNTATMPPRGRARVVRSDEGWGLLGGHIWGLSHGHLQRRSGPTSYSGRGRSRADAWLWTAAVDDQDPLENAAPDRALRGLFRTRSAEPQESRGRAGGLRVEPAAQRPRSTYWEPTVRTMEGPCEVTQPRFASA